VEGSKSAPIAKAWIQLAPTLDGSERAIQKQLGGVGTPAGKAAGKGFGGGFRLGLGPVAALGLGAGAFALGKEAISAASDLGESLNAVDVVFKKNSASIQEMGANAAETLGLSNVEFNGLAVQFGGFAKAVGGKGKGVVKFLDNITGRAADFASVMNLDVADAAALFQSGLAGETEPLRRYGIDLSAAAVQAFAYAEGIAKTGKQLTESEKVQARYGLLMRETKQAQGDFANTSDSLANSQRILNAEWANAQAQLGEGLLPVMTDVTHWLVDEGLPALTGFIDDLGDPTTTVGGIAKSLGDIWTAIEPSVDNAFSTGANYAANILDGIAGALEADKNGTLDSFLATKGQEITDWANITGPTQNPVHGIAQVVTGASMSAADGTLWEDWKAGVADIISDDPPSDREVRLMASAIERGFESASLDFGKASWDAMLSPHAITADPTAGAGFGPPTIIVYGDIVTPNGSDLVRQAQKEAKTNNSSGSRNTKPPGSSTQRRT